MKIRYILLGLFLCFEAANFTGFSWTRLRRLSDEELINAAIHYNYSNVYADLTEFKADYSSFNPGVFYWADLTGEAGSQFLNKLVGLKLFNVRLPDAVVIVASNGFARFSRPCGDNAWCTPAVAPDRPRLGIVGTVQDGPPDFNIAKDFSVQWVDGSEGTVFLAGHCFAAFSQSQKPTLRISDSRKNDAITIRDQYGYRLVAIPDIKRAAYGSRKISEREFDRSKTCEEAVRAGWASMGGWWKR